MHAIGNHLDVKVLQVARFHGAGIAAVAALGDRGHGAVEMRHQGVAMRKGLFAGGAGCVGMGNGRDDAAAPEFLAEAHGPFEFRGGAHADRLRKRLQQRKILLRHRPLEPGRILGARLGQGKVWTFEMDPGELRSLFVQGKRLAIGTDGPLIIGKGSGRERRRHGRRPMQGMLPGRHQVGFHRPVQEIVPPAAMDMHVDESGTDPLSGGIDHLPFGRFGLGDDGFDPAVPDDEGHPGSDTFRQEEASAAEDGNGHYSLTFKTSPASRATVSFQSSV